MSCTSKEELQKHLHEAVNLNGSSFMWDDDKYLSPFLQDDSLLYNFYEDDEDEEGDTMIVDTNELETYLSQFEHIDIHDEDAPDLMVPSENEGKDVKMFLGKDTNTAKPLDTVSVNDPNCSSYSSRKKEMDTIPSTTIVAKEIKNINKSYFSSYSSFGIHRDMISDKVPQNLGFEK